jgi:hypothetical protein
MPERSLKRCMSGIIHRTFFSVVGPGVHYIMHREGSALADEDT